MSLNEKQKQAVYATDGPLLVLAGAGSGKTTVLRHRIGHLIKNKGVQPHNILAVTFTNKAAEEMKQRVASTIGDEASESIWLGTFHSLCGRMLREYPLLEWDADFIILDTHDVRKLLREIIVDLNFDPAHVTPQGTQYYLSLLRNELVDSLSYKSLNPVYPFIDWEKVQRLLSEKIPADKHENLRLIYAEYEKRLIEYNSLDFDGLIMQTLRLFHDFPHVLSYYQSLFRYIMVDEYQDTNHSQYTWVTSLAKKHRNLGVVGDDFQSIYAFRGSDIQNILRFDEDFPDATIVKLEENYRCSPIILQAANELISQNTNQWKKTLFTSKLEGEKISYFEAYDDRDESRYVIKKIQTHISSGGSYRDIAVLFRMNSQVERLIEGMEKASIPYRVVGEPNFLDQVEIKDFITVLQSQTHSLEQPIPEWLSSVLLSTELLSNRTEEQVFRMFELISICYSYFNAYSDHTLADFLAYLREWGRFEQYCDDNAVQLMTLHASKGLEFPVVFLIGMEENVFPHRKSIPLPEQLEEERRLCYVGITRAKEKLHLTNAKFRKIYGKEEENAPSRFLYEFSEELMDNLPKRKI